MNLLELIKMIPGFVAHMLDLKHKKGKEIEFEELKEGQKVPKMYGKFHLGLQYDINIWKQNQSCGVF